MRIAGRPRPHLLLGLCLVYGVSGHLTSTLAQGAAEKLSWGDWQTVPDGRLNKIAVRFAVREDRGLKNEMLYFLHFQYRHGYSEKIKFKVRLKTDKGSWTDHFNLAPGEESRKSKSHNGRQMIEVQAKITAINDVPVKDDRKPAAESPHSETPRSIEIPLDTSVQKVMADAFGLPSANKRNSEFGVLRAYWNNTRNVRTVSVNLAGVPQDARFSLEDGQMVARWRERGTAQERVLLSPSEWQQQGLPAQVQRLRIHYGLDFQSRNMAGELMPMEFYAGLPGTVKLYPSSSTNTIGVIPTARPDIEVQYLHAGTIAVEDGQPVLPQTPLGKTGNAGTGKKGVIHLHVQVRDRKTKELLDPDEVLPSLLER